MRLLRFTRSVLSNLYGLWFDKQGNKTVYLKTLEDGGIDAGNTCGILQATADGLEKHHDFLFGTRDRKVFKSFRSREERLYDNVREILHGGKVNVCSALKDFHGVWFDGNV